MGACAISHNQENAISGILYQSQDFIDVKNNKEVNFFWPKLATKKLSGELTIEAKHCGEWRERQWAGEEADANVMADKHIKWQIYKLSKI